MSAWLEESYLMNCHDRQNKNVRKFNNVPNFFWYITQTVIKYQEYQNQLYIILYIEIFMTPFMVHLCWYGCMKYRNSKWFSDCVKLHFLLHRQFFKMCNSWNSWYHFMRIKFGHLFLCMRLLLWKRKRGYLSCGFIVIP